MQDWQAFLKLDNAATIDFLSSYASALTTEGQISERAVGNLKVSLASVTPQLASTHASIVSLLAENDAEFLDILNARYGSSGFAWNHMRATTRNHLSESCAALAAFADLALKKAELFMNRHFVANSQAGQSRRELFPSVLLHTAKVLHDAAKELREVIIDLSVMRPADILDTLGEQYEREHRIALMVGFNGLESESLAFCRTELRATRRVVAAFDELGAAIPHLIAGLSENTATNSSTKKLETECELLAAECQRLLGARLEVSTNLNVWETRRLGFLFELYSLNQRIARVSKLFVESLSPKDNTATEWYLTDDFERAVACNLIQRGTTAKTAAKAAKDLIDYCKHHKTTPSTLIPAELKKINNDLNEETLSFAAKLSSSSMIATPGGSAEKSRFMEAAKKIRKSLVVASPFSVSLGAVLIGIFMSSCGVKTQVVTDAIDPRPAIEFRQVNQTQINDQTKTSTKQKQDNP